MTPVDPRAFPSRRKALALAFLLAFQSASLFASARMTYMLGGKPTPIEWTSFPVHYSIDRSAGERLAGGASSVERSFNAWQAVSGTSVRFQYDGIVAAGAGKDGINTVALEPALYANSGFVAYTTTWFDDSGRMLEADIQIDETSVRDGLSLEGLVRHEVGHLLGLDHSGVVSSTMYPYLAPHSSGELDSDDILAVTSAYRETKAAALSRLGGVVLGSSGPLFGAQVVALSERGAPVASCLTRQDGTFVMEGLPEGNYRLYVEPLDGPLNPTNLAGVWSGAPETTFRTEFMGGGALRVGAGSSQENLVLHADQPATLNPKWVGTFPPFSSQVQLASTVEPVDAGGKISIAVGGEGIVGGQTQFQVMNSGFSRISEFRYGPNYVWATFDVSREAVPGSTVILVSSGNETATLTGALRVVAVEGGGGRARPVR